MNDMTYWVQVKQGPVWHEVPEEFEWEFEAKEYAQNELHEDEEVRVGYYDEFGKFNVIWEAGYAYGL